MTARAAYVAALAVAAFVAAACGKKGPPQPPLHPVPVAVEGFSVERRVDQVADQVTLSFKVPAANQDRTTPPRVDGVEIYALTQPATAPPPTPAQLAVVAYRVAVVEVRRSGEPPKSTADKRPTAGDPATFVEKLAAVAPATSPTMRYYAAAGTVGNRRGPASAVLALPLAAPPEPPADVKADYSEKEIRVTWTATSPAHRFLVEEVEARPAGATPKRPTAEPIAAPEFTAPVEFGRERCFAVRAAEVSAGVLSAGAASVPVCVTPADRFPPAPPTDLITSGNEGVVDLVWTASPSADVAGYVVLRAEGADGTLQPLTPAPIAVTQYKDATVRAGVTYAYAVVAVDGATPRNTSEQSNRRVVTARGY